MQRTTLVLTIGALLTSATPYTAFAGPNGTDMITSPKLNQALRLEYVAAEPSNLNPDALQGTLHRSRAFPNTTYAQMRARTGVPGADDPVVTRLPNTTGNDRDVVIAPGSTGADTIQTDSAAAGNAEQPSRAVPQGGGGGQ